MMYNEISVTTQIKQKPALHVSKTSNFGILC